MTREKKGKLVNWAYQIFVGVAVTVITGLLIGGSREYSEIKTNSDQVPGIVRDVRGIRTWIHYHDSLTTIRYILDTVQQGAIRREVRGINQRLDRNSLKELTKL